MKKISFLFATILVTLFTSQRFQPNWESLNTRKMPGWFQLLTFFKKPLRVSIFCPGLIISAEKFIGRKCAASFYREEN